MRIINGAKGSHCLYPFQIDPYYNGCSHGCKYCYAASLSNSFGLPFNEYTETDVELLRKRLEKPRGTMGEFIKRKHPLRIGGMSDPFMNGRNHDITRSVIEVLNEFEYPHLIFTKSSSICDFIDVLNPLNCQIQISVSNRNWKAIEPNASSIAKRIKACEVLSDASFDVIGRIAPIIPPWADGAEWTEENEVCEGVDFSMPLQFENAGAKGLILEMIRLTPFMRKNLEAAGVHIDATITDKCIRKSGTIYYSLTTRQKYYDALSYTDLPVTYCDVDLWNPSIDGDCCQFTKQIEV